MRKIKRFIRLLAYSRRLEKCFKQQGFPLTANCKFPNFRYAWEMSRRGTEIKLQTNDLPLFKDTLSGKDIDFDIPNYLKGEN